MALDKVVCCENNHKFRLGIAGDGYRNCPECNELLTEAHVDVTKGEPFTLQYLSDAFIKNKEPKSSARKLSIDAEMNTDKMQLKLRAIAKHVSALADELDAIDNAWSCSECGHGTKVTRFHDDTRDYTQCETCGALVDDELPTHLEGSD